MKIGSGGRSILVPQFFFMMFESPEYCQSFEYFFVSVSYFDEEESVNEDTENFFLPTH